MWIPTIFLVVLFFIAPELFIGLAILAGAIIFWPITLCIFGVVVLAALFSGD